MYGHRKCSVDVDICGSGLLMTPGVAFFYGGMVAKRLEHVDAVGGAISVTAIIWTFWGWSIAYAGKDIGGISAIRPPASCSRTRW